MSTTINWPQIQQKWQKAWSKAELGKATVDKKKDKFFMIFAYPGISGYLHVGHMRGFSYTDAICRYERMQGKEVLFPVGTHASGNQALAFANKVKRNDPDWIGYLKNNSCPEKKIKELTDADKVVKYFNDVYVNEYWKKFGFLCDWDRFTCTIFPDYEKFIQWQFRKLQQKNLLVQKPYFATACVNCGPVAVDPSETDLAKGGNAEKVEYTLLKFKLIGNKNEKNGNEYLVAATLRPETIYGQTNLWINAEASYVRVTVNGENWILSKEAAEKLGFQKDNVVIGGEVTISQLLGKKAVAPGLEQEIIILPASFCDPKIGSGIVTSVPSDAPYDYVALKHLQDNLHEVHKYGLPMEEVQDLDLIPIITTEGYGEFPAKEIVEKMQITTLDDPQLEEATKEIYQAGYHKGVMAQSCGKYAGKRVEEAKELIKAELLEQGKADVFHDLSEEVICRCGGKVFIKRIDDQWFIRYSDPELTERSKEQAREMMVYPDEYYQHLPSILDWFSDRACARLGNWLGSKLPFDQKWIIEPISDSTLYPAYYIVSKFINNKTITTKELTEEFFDYIFLGKGRKQEQEKGLELGERMGPGKRNEHWQQIREEFNYFYPLDLNLGGKEHKTVHFPVFIMNHVAILPEEKWPRGIFVNWWVTGKGSKISKSKGGAEPIPQAMEKYGVDAMRLYYAHIGSPHTDVVWEEEVVLNYKQALERIYSLVQELGSNGQGKQKTGKRKTIDHWLLSRMQAHLRSIHSSMKTYNLRELASTAYFTIYDDFRWYVRRGGENKTVVSEALDIWCKLMNPITPHLSEELNPQKAKKKAAGSAPALISASSWPQIEDKNIDLHAEAGEELVKDTLDSIRNVLKLANVEKPSSITLFIAENWLYELFTLLAHEVKVTRNLGEIMKKVLEAEQLKMKGKEISRIVNSVVKDVSKLPSMVLTQEEELGMMKEAQEFLQTEFSEKGEKDFSVTIKIMRAEESNHPKARGAWPGKVGILVE